MDLEIIILIEVSQTEKGEYHMILFYVESKKIDTNKLIYRTEKWAPYINKTQKSPMRSTAILLPQIGKRKY